MEWCLRMRACASSVHVRACRDQGSDSRRSVREMAGPIGGHMQQRPWHPVAITSVTNLRSCQTGMPIQQTLQRHHVARADRCNNFNAERVLSRNDQHALIPVRLLQVPPLSLRCRLAHFYFVGQRGKELLGSFVKFLRTAVAYQDLVMAQSFLAAGNSARPSPVLKPTAGSRPRRAAGSNRRAAWMMF